jgi:hypothetical protein
MQRYQVIGNGIEIKDFSTKAEAEKYKEGLIAQGYKAQVWDKYDNPLNRMFQF